MCARVCVAAQLRAKAGSGSCRREPPTAFISLHSLLPRDFWISVAVVVAVVVSVSCEIDSVVLTESLTQVTCQSDP